MKQLKINLPNELSPDKYNIEVNNIDNNIIVDFTFKDFKFGDFVRVYNGIYNTIGIIENIGTIDCTIFITQKLSITVLFKYIHKANNDDKIDIQHFLDENNLVVDYDKKEIVHKRWRAEKGNTFYYVSSSGIVLNAEENFWECNNNIYEYGNYFRTREQAESVAKEVKAIFEKHKND